MEYEERHIILNASLNDEAKKLFPNNEDSRIELLSLALEIILIQVSDGLDLQNLDKNKMNQLGKKAARAAYMRMYRARPNNDDGFQAIQPISNMNHITELMLENVLNSKPERYQKVFILKKQGYKNSQIAEMLNIHPDSVRRIIREKFTDVKEILKDSMSDFHDFA